MVGLICLLGHDVPPEMHRAHPKFPERHRKENTSIYPHTKSSSSILILNSEQPQETHTVSKKSPNIRPSTGTRQKHPDETSSNWSFQSVHKHRCSDKCVLQLAKLFPLPSVLLHPELLPYYFLRPRPYGRNRREEVRRV